MIWFHAVSLCSHPCCVWQSLNEPTWALWSKQHFAGSVKTRNQQNSVSPRLSGFGFDSLGYVYSWSVLEFKATEALLKPKPWERERERPWVKLCKLSMLVSSNVRSCVHVCAWWENNVKTMKTMFWRYAKPYIFLEMFFSIFRMMPAFSQGMTSWKWDVLQDSRYYQHAINVRST